MALHVWKVTPERAAIRLVRAILRDNPSSLTTKEIYKEAIRREAKREYPHPPTVVGGAPTQQLEKLVNKSGAVRPPPPTPPHPENAIRSVRCVCIFSGRALSAYRVRNRPFYCSTFVFLGTSRPSCFHTCRITSEKSKNSIPFEPSPTRRSNTA